jgi:cellulose synthase/poly-beta-1,6-N-acetylglucosamine synthase-like glycosyltransferase
VNFTKSFRRICQICLAISSPFFLAFLSWLYFPIVVDWIVRNLFGYANSEVAANIIWIAIIRIFYTWYTFVAIGIAGSWIIAALLARRRRIKTKPIFYPLVSFVVPAYNQEKNVSGCVASLFRCAEAFPGSCEIIVVDDGSKDLTYETVFSAINLGRSQQPRVRCKVVRHSANLGKIQALRTGVKRALGSLIAIVDADSEWAPSTLSDLVDYLLVNGKQAVTGYVNPKGADSKQSLIVQLQRLEYSQGLSVSRCAQGLGNKVLVISGAIGLYDADLLSKILSEEEINSVTEDLEITLEMHKKQSEVDYVNFVQSSTVVPMSWKALWRQRLRWYTGWLYNTLKIHRNLVTKRSRLTALLFYCYVFEYAGSFVDLIAVTVFPFIWWFAPDPILFGLKLLIFVPYGLLIGLINQSIALYFAYGNWNCDKLLLFIPFYPLLRFLKVLARSKSMLSYFKGSNGKWHS